MAGPVNAIIGNDFGTNIPETQPGDEFLAETKKMAKFTRTAEYKRQKEWAEAKIKFYQQYLPDGRPVSGVPMAERADHWTVANEVIAILNEFLTSYDQASEDVREAEKPRA